MCREGLSVDTGGVLYRGHDWEYQHQETGSRVDNVSGDGQGRVNRLELEKQDILCKNR